MRRVRGSPRVLGESSSSARSSLDFRSPLPPNEPVPSRVPSTRPFRLTAAAADAVISSALLQGQQRPPGHRKRNKKRGGGGSHFGGRRNTTASEAAATNTADLRAENYCAPAPPESRPQHSDSSGVGDESDETNCILLPSHARTLGWANGNDPRLMSSLVASKLFRHALNDAVNSQQIPPSAGMRRVRHQQPSSPPPADSSVARDGKLLPAGNSSLPPLLTSSSCTREPPLSGLPYTTDAAGAAALSHTSKLYSTQQQSQQQSSQQSSQPLRRSAAEPCGGAAADHTVTLAAASQSSTVASSHPTAKEHQQHRSQISAGGGVRRLHPHAAPSCHHQGEQAKVKSATEDLTALKGYGGRFTWSAAAASTPNVKLAGDLAASFNWSAFLYATTPHFLRPRFPDAGDSDEDKILSEFALPYRLARRIKYKQLKLQRQRRSSGGEMKLLGDLLQGTKSSGDFRRSARRRSSTGLDKNSSGGGHGIRDTDRDGDDAYHAEDDDDDTGSTSAASWTANEEDFVDTSADRACCSNPLLTALGAGLDITKERPTLIDAESLSTNELLAKTFNHKNSCLEHLPLASQCKLLGLLDGLGLVSSLIQSTDDEEATGATGALFAAKRSAVGAEGEAQPRRTQQPTASAVSSPAPQFAFRLSDLWDSWAATSRTGVEAPYVDPVTGEVSSLVWHPLLSGFSLVGNESGKFRGVRLDYLEQRPPHTRKPFSVTLRRLMQQRELTLTPPQLELLTQSTNEDLNKLQSWMSVLWVPTQLMTPTQPLPRQAVCPPAITVEQLVELSIANVTSAAKAAAQKDTSFPQLPSYVVFYAFYSTTDCELAKLNNSAHVYCPCAVKQPPAPVSPQQPASRVSGLFNSTPQLARFGVFPQRGLQQGWHVETPNSSMSVEAATDALLSQSISYFDRWFIAEGFSHADYIYGKRRSRLP